MRILLTHYFARLAKHDGLSDKKITEACEELENGLHNGNLGGNVYKKRVGIDSRGKRGGMRTIVAMRLPGNIFFLYGYPKNKKDTLTDAEEATYKMLAKNYLNMTEITINRLIKSGELREVSRHEKK